MNFVDRLQNKIGIICAWLLLLMALLTFVIVILRYVFNSGWVWLQELVIYLHAVVFLMTMGYGLLKNGHVRVDIFYANWSPKRKALVNFLGSLFLLIPVCVVIFYQSWSYVLNSWAVFESSQDAEGLAFVYLLKSFILLSTFVLLLQGFSLIYKSFKVLRGESSVG